MTRHNNTTISVLGTGAIGGSIADAMLRSGHDVQLHARTPFGSLRVDYPDTTYTHVVSCSGTAQVDALRPTSWVFVTTKAHQTASLSDALARTTRSEAARVAVLQNGVEHVARLMRIAPWLQREQILEVMVECPAGRAAPGHVIVRRAPWLVVGDSALGRAFEELFEVPEIKVRLTDDMTTTLWEKLCLNVVSGAIPALTDRPGAVFREPDILDLCRGLVQEAYEVGLAHGAKLEPTIIDEILDGRRNTWPEGITSMLQDRRAGRTLEADARNGAVWRLGASVGIATPFNQMAAVILSQINR